MSEQRFLLMVSYNAGVSYEEDCRSDDIATFQPRMDELDAEMWRWYVETADGEMLNEPSCKIHSGLLSFIKRLTGK